MTIASHARILPLVLLLVACAPEGADDAGHAGRPEAEAPSARGPVPMAPGAQCVFYNVENLFDTLDAEDVLDDDFTPAGRLRWNTARYRTKLDHLAGAIRMAGSATPVLIGLAEVENASVVQDLARTGGLASTPWAVVHFDSPDERGIDVALLVDTRHFAVLHAEPLAVPLRKDRTRDILHATLAGADDTLEVFVNHWPSRREGVHKSAPKRAAAATVLRGAVEALDPRHPVLIMGDLNDGPGEASVQEVLGARCRRDAALVDLMCVDQPPGHGSHNFQGAWEYLDQFLVNDRLIGRVSKTSALWDERLLFRHPRYGRSPDKTYSGDSYKGGYSDHLPIALTFR